VDLKAHLIQVCNAHGPSGYEGPVREVVAEAWRPFVDSLEVGKLGSLVGYKLGSGSVPRRRIMLCAHMDEIGLVISDIDRGFLKVSRLGGIDNRIVPGMPVLVHGKQALKGVVGLPPLHTLENDKRSRYPKLDELVVDLGLPPDEVSALVSIGDVITMDTPMLTLQGTRLAGKALDDRACVAAITVCLDALQARQHGWDVLAVASVQEEVGCHGARSEAYRLQPDIAIALDVTFASQPGVEGVTHKLGDGVPISLGANFHPALYEAINAAAERLEMTLHADPIPMQSGTDAWPIQVSRDGIPTALLSIPVRNMHTPVETVDTKDIERAGRLMAEFICGLTPDFLATIVWDKEKEA
jgi:putative aminopeptidase FrvX